jgi:hypothetical protein
MINQLGFRRSVVAILHTIAGQALSSLLRRDVIGLVRQLSPHDAETVAYTRWLALWLAIEEQMSTLDHLKSLAGAYGLFS